MPSPGSPARSSEDDAASEDGEGNLAATSKTSSKFALGFENKHWNSFKASGRFWR